MIDALKLHLQPAGGNDPADPVFRIASALERIASAVEREEKRNAARAMADHARTTGASARARAIRALP